MFVVNYSVATFCRPVEVELNFVGYKSGRITFVFCKIVNKMLTYPLFWGECDKFSA